MVPTLRSTFAGGLRRALIVGVGAACAALAQAQSVPDTVRAQVASARLGAGYAQMINLSSTPDLSAASYRIDAIDPSATLDVIRLPYQARWLPLSAGTDLYWKVEGGWLQYKQDFPWSSPSGVPGTFGSSWTAYSVGAGVLAKVALAPGITLEPGIDVALARLRNRTSYVGSAALLQPAFDGLLFNWNAGAWLVTPGIALEWTDAVAEGTALVRGHVARSWVASFDETDPVQQFREATNVYSVRAEYSHPTGWQVFDRAVHWVAYGSYAGFFGANRDVLGFSSVAELGGGLELPIIAERAKAERLRLSAGYLFGSDVRGWSVGLSVEY